MELSVSIEKQCSSRLIYDSSDRSFALKNREHAADLKNAMKLISLFNRKTFTTIESQKFDYLQIEDKKELVTKALNQDFILEEYSPALKTILERFATAAKPQLLENSMQTSSAMSNQLFHKFYDCARKAVIDPNTGVYSGTAFELSEIEFELSGLNGKFSSPLPLEKISWKQFSSYLDSNADCSDFAFYYLGEYRLMAQIFRQKACVEELIVNPKKYMVDTLHYELVNEPQKNDLVIYTKNEKALHFAIFEKGGSVLSKWGNGFWIYRHEIDALPLQLCGDKVLFFRKKRADGLEKTLKDEIAHSKHLVEKDSTLSESAICAKLITLFYKHIENKQLVVPDKGPFGKWYFQKLERILRTKFEIVSVMEGEPRGKIFEKLTAIIETTIAEIPYYEKPLELFDKLV